MEKKNIKLTGNGFINSGSYGQIKITGNTKSEGNVSVDYLTIMGNADLKGNIVGGICKIHGDLKIGGNVSVKKLKVSGNCHINGECNVEELIVKGDCSFRGTVRGKNINIYGSIKADSDFNGEEIKVKGKVNCNGLLNAEKIEIVPIANSHCKEIGASSISIRKSNLGLWGYVIYNYGKLNCELIEGDDLILHNVIANTVRGKSIELIKGCAIENLEYSHKLKVGNLCKIVRQMKV